MTKVEWPVEVELAYVNNEQSCIIPVKLTGPATIREVIEKSGILEDFPEIDLAVNRVGIFGRLRELDNPVVEGDRVEIYRALLADPKESRRRRAGVQKKNARKRQAAKQDPDVNRGV